MPEICRFFGIIISMHYGDHSPPHFHVRYGGQKAIVGITAMALLGGHLSARVFGLVMEWTALHREELMQDWERASNNEPLKKIAPLE